MSRFPSQKKSRIISRLATPCVTTLLLLLASITVAQTPPATANSFANRDNVNRNDLYHVTVHAKDDDGKPIANEVIFLRAARPRGPFEPKAPPPQHEWTSITDANGTATFSVEPINADGLQLQAFMAYKTRAYESSPKHPEDSLTLSIKTYKPTTDVAIVKKAIQINDLRTVIQLWEGYVSFTQFYTVTNTSDQALDLANLPGIDYEKGLPFHLPLKAKGISADGTGQLQPVQSSVYWEYYLKPHEVASFQVRFSISETGHNFIYEQKVDYPTKAIEVIVPIETEFRKVPRLDHVVLTAPGFTNVGATDENSSPLGMRPDYDFIAAWGASAKPGESFLFRLSGLPFKESKVHLIVLIVALACGVALLIYGLKFALSRDTVDSLTEDDLLNQYKDRLILSIGDLEASYNRGDIDESQYRLQLRELQKRLALILCKLEPSDETD